MAAQKTKGAALLTLLTIGQGVQWSQEEQQEEAGEERLATEKGGQK